jgi:hypothetical protein
MPTIAIRKNQTKKNASFYAELQEAYGIATKRELKARLQTAMAWACEHGIEFAGWQDGDTRGFNVEFGSVTSRDTSEVRRFNFHATAHRNDASKSLVKSALALMIFAHPAMRRMIEAGQVHRVA